MFHACTIIGQPEWCATEDMFCLRERISHVTGPGIGQEEMIEEYLSCDSANICAMQNLTKTSHSCKVILVSTITNTHVYIYVGCMGVNISWTSLLMGKPTMWFSNRFDTNRTVQAWKMA